MGYGGADGGNSRAQTMRVPAIYSIINSTPIHSRHTVSRATMITGPRNRPTNPNDCNPPSIPITTSRNGSRAVPPINAGKIRLSPISSVTAPNPNSAAGASSVAPSTDNVRAAAASASHAPNGTIANTIVNTANSSG